MLGLEDLAHAASPDLVEDGVAAQDQGFDFACRHLLGLELGQQILLEQFPQQFFAVFGGSLGRHEVFELAGCNDARIRELLDDAFQSDGHIQTLPQGSG